LLTAADLALIGAMIVLLVALYFMISFRTPAGGAAAVVRLPGRAVRMELETDRTRRFGLANEGSVTVEVRGGRARIIESTCPNKICVNAGWISRPGERIICLPNRVSVEIEGGEEAEGIDARTY
jgi:hypothetical protein